MEQRVQRSWLIAPANDEARLADAANSGADVVVLDLQDTVHETKKHEARARVEDAISQMRERGAEVYVRCDPELLYADLAASVRRGLHARGLRFRLHRGDLPGRPDLAFPRHRAAIFVHGCFWHGHDCPLFSWPRTRAAFWREKANCRSSIMPTRPKATAKITISAASSP